MEFKIKTNGFDEIDRMLNEMIEDVKPDGFAKWAKKIERTAKEICNDVNGNRIEFKPEKGVTKIKMKFADKDAIKCLKESIQRHKNSMSLGIRAFYEQGIPPQLEKLEKQFKN